MAMGAEWGDLRYFLELSRSGTLAAAARKLRVDYTTVGRRLAALEQDLGAKLFERTPEGLILTEAGQSIRAAAEEMEEAALLVEQRALGADRKLAGIVRRTTNSLSLHRAVALGIGIGGLPCYIGDSDRELRRVFPDVPVEIDDLWLVVHADLTRTSRVRAIIDALEARLAAVAKDLIGERFSDRS